MRCIKDFTDGGGGGGGEGKTPCNNWSDSRNQSSPSDSLSPDVSNLDTGDMESSWSDSSPSLHDSPNTTNSCHNSTTCSGHCRSKNEGGVKRSQGNARRSRRNNSNSTPSWSCSASTRRGVHLSSPAMTSSDSNEPANPTKRGAAKGGKKRVKCSPCDETFSRRHALWDEFRLCSMVKSKTGLAISVRDSSRARQCCLFIDVPKRGSGGDFY
ncbi:hypothetical protein K435DRAFT_862265 [Dendrothele bispora CBS 962.96]|uniref:Uncharacterized protein n=1 Tax=Dendrothele bispora (strain CBS 962.96) TaxID=1314807 RepID=A0A4S8LTL4_DENBC|nr:hypothetical protein K435DRAFT_862265 [Dendrothele bispora CBS 962.96]